MKPELTLEQKLSFEAQLREIVSKNTAASQKAMGTAPIIWTLDIPFTESVYRELDRKGKDQYVALINKLKNRNI